MTDTIQAKLRRCGQHDGHSSDTHVNCCIVNWEAADHIDALEAEIERLREELVVCSLCGETYEADEINTDQSSVKWWVESKGGRLG